MKVYKAPYSLSSSTRDSFLMHKVPPDVQAGGGEGHGFFHDFLWEREGTDTLDGWTGTQYTSGDVGQVGDEGGWLRLLPNTSSQTNTGFQVQAAAVFEAGAGKRIAFGARVQATDGDKQNIVIGLAINDVDLPGNIVSTTADAVVFYVGGDGNIKYQVNTSAGGMTAVDTGSDLGDATPVWLECVIDEANAVEFYVDGTRIVRYTTTSNIPTSTAMKFSMANEATEDDNNYLEIDRCYCWQWSV